MTISIETFQFTEPNILACWAEIRALFYFRGQETPTLKNQSKEKVSSHLDSIEIQANWNKLSIPSPKIDTTKRAGMLLAKESSHLRKYRSININLQSRSALRQHCRALKD